MFEGVSANDLAPDRERLVVEAVLPAVGTIVGMALTFSIMGAIMILRETLIVGRLWTQLFALATMYLVPQFVVGLVIGRRYGLSVGPPIAAGLAPVAFLTLSLGLFGGPISAPFRNIGLTVAAIGGWSLLCAAGMVLGSGALQSRLAE